MTASTIINATTQASPSPNSNPCCHESHCEEIRIKVAEAMGWKRVEVYEWVNGVRPPKQWADFDVLPNYPEDLNACAEFEATLTDHELMLMHHRVTKTLRQMKDHRPAWRAPAKVRCLAYLKVKGLIP